MAPLTGKRALVTGASSGIGAAIARLLAAEGVELVLTARRRPALEAVAAECTARGAAVHVVAADLGTPGGAAEAWAAATAAGPIDILVNNAGFGYFRRFDEADLQRDAELLQLNIGSLVELSRRFVEARAGKPERAYLLNIASIAAYQSIPNFAVYASSKAFVRNFTEALHDELAGSPVSATCVCPGGTHTDFHAQAGAGDYSWLANRSMMSAEAVAVRALRAMRGGQRTMIPGLLNKLSCWSVRLVPRRFASWMSRRVLGTPRPGALPSRTRAA
jgi:short-subunit dehydrogenase